MTNIVESFTNVFLWNQLLRNTKQVYYFPQRKRRGDMTHTTLKNPAIIEARTKNLSLCTPNPLPFDCTDLLFHLRKNKRSQNQR